MRPRTALLAPVTVLAVGAAAFLAYGAHTRSGEVTYTRGGVAFGGVEPRAAATRAPSTAPRATPRPSISAVAVVASAPAVADVPTPVSTRGASPRATASTAPAAARSRAVPVTGTYKVRTTGKESVRFGPISFCSRAFPTDTAWVVSRAQGESPTSYVLDHRLFPGSAGQHDERHLYRYAGGRVLLDFEQATVTCAGQRQSTDVTYEPAQLRVDEHLREGTTWTSKGGDADRTETTRSTVLRREDVRIGTRSVPTWVVETKVDISGSESGSRTQRWWWAPSLALPVRVQESITASRSGAAYTSTLDSAVVSLPAGS